MKMDRRKAISIISTISFVGLFSGFRGASSKFQRLFNDFVFVPDDYPTLSDAIESGAKRIYIRGTQTIESNNVVFQGIEFRGI